MTAPARLPRGDTARRSVPAPLPDPPETLSEPATGVWRRLAPHVPAGRLTAATADMFAMLCTHIATWHEADQMIQDGGLLIAAGPDLVTSPALAVRTQADTLTARWAKTFGLTPDTPAVTSHGTGMRHLREA